MTSPSTRQDRRICLLCLGILVLVNLRAQAFDGAMQIEGYHLNPENFVDIQSFQFSPAQDRAWRRTEQGWRITGGSLGLDLLYLQWQVKLQERLASNLHTGLRIHHEEFYERKPLRFEVEVGWEALPALSIGLAGQPAYDKRSADYGAFLTWGDTTQTYLRLHQLRQDLFYNSKNFYDQTRQSPHPIENRLEGTLLRPTWEVGLQWIEELPSQFWDPEIELLFDHKGQRQWLWFEHQLSGDWVFGWQGRQLQSQKSREAALSWKSEDHRSQQVYWQHQLLQVDGTLSSGTYLSAGLRWDLFQQQLWQYDAPLQNEDVELRTLQVFSTLRQPLKQQAFWEGGLYLGQVQEWQQDFGLGQGITKESLEGKLRLSWGVEGLSVASGTLLFTSTWNLDNLANDFWDGGNITYQR